jgi:hypothetical protein
MDETKPTCVLSYLWRPQGWLSQTRALDDLNNSFIFGILFLYFSLLKSIFSKGEWWRG